MKKIQEGHLPSSSQPSVGSVLELYDKYPNDTIINISMADGLSGTYQTAHMATQMTQNPDRITVVNTGTLCGPHRYMVEHAVKMANEGASKTEILGKLSEQIEQTDSFLIPNDYDFLVRGGRLSPLVGQIGKLLRAVPIMTLTKDRRQLERYAIKRTFKSAVDAIASHLTSKQVDGCFRIYLCHACAPELAEKAKKRLIELGVEAEFETHLLSPVFTTQGGPGCVAIQSIRL